MKLKETLLELESRLASIKPEIQNLKTILNDFIEIEKIGNHIEFIDAETATLYESKDSLEVLKSEKLKPFLIKNSRTALSETDSKLKLTLMSPSI